MEIEKLEISTNWSKKERLAVAGLIAHNFRVSSEGSDQSSDFFLIEVVCTADSDQLEKTRSSFSEYIVS